MTIKGEDIGKKFGRNWIFRNQNFEISPGEAVAITGKNGAGKSTLLQIMAGYLTPSHGKMLINEVDIDESAHSSVFVGPYTEIIEEFTLEEFLTFHSKFKKASCSIKEMTNSASLPLNKPIAEFSTGMRQRAKLITAFYFENDAIFMDEPTSNLDDEGFEWWEKCTLELRNRIILLASNDLQEINICERKIDLNHREN